MYRSRRVGSSLAAVATLALVVSIGAASGRTSPAVACAAPAGLAYTDAEYAGQAGTVWLAAADGAGRRRVVTGATPRLAPNGRMVAVTKFAKSAGLGIFDSCGRSLGTFFTARNVVTDLAWSPDSRWLTAVVEDANDNHVFDQRLELINVATGRATTVHTAFIAAFGAPSFSRTKPYQLAFDESPHADGTFEVWSGVVGKKPVQVTRVGQNEYPIWGPRGLLYVRAGRNSSVLYRLQAGVEKKVMSLPEGAWPIAASANGTHLAVENAACGVVWPLSVDAAARRVVHKFANGYAPYGISPNGGTLLIAGAPPAAECGGPRSTIETVPFKGGAPTVVAQGADPSWADSDAVGTLQ